MKQVDVRVADDEFDVQFDAGETSVAAMIEAAEGAGSGFRAQEVLSPIR